MTSNSLYKSLHCLTTCGDSKELEWELMAAHSHNQQNYILLQWISAWAVLVKFWCGQQWRASSDTCDNVGLETILRRTESNHQSHLKQPSSWLLYWQEYKMTFFSVNYVWKSGGCVVSVTRYCMYICLPLSLNPASIGPRTAEGACYIKRELQYVVCSHNVARLKSDFNSVYCVLELVSPSSV